MIDEATEIVIIVEDELYFGVPDYNTVCDTFNGILFKRVCLTLKQVEGLL